MKYLKIEYPDRSIHNIIVNNFYYNQEENNYIISFYDMSESQRMYSILEEDNIFLVTSIIKEAKINNLEEKNPNLLPKIIKYLHKEEEKNKITVYKSNYSLFINENLCHYYNIAKNSTKRKIKGIDCLEITKYDLEEITKKSSQKLNYISIYEPKITRTYNYYQEKNNLYVNRTIYELIIKNNLEIEGIPKILENRNCYSITKNQLDQFNKKLHCVGMKINLKTTLTIIYHEKNTNKFYLPLKTECIHSDKVILNKKCQEIKKEDLEKLQFPNSIIVSVYTSKKIIREIIICSYEDKIYISKEILDEIERKLSKTEKIKIKNGIYLKITADDIDYIKESFLKKNTILKFIIRKIIPKTI